MKSISRMKKISVLLLSLILLLAFFPMPNALAATYGPYSSITSMPVTAMNSMLVAMESHVTFSQVTYNGVKCYKFTGLGNTVYVNASAFRTTNSRSSYPSDSSVSGQLTANLNNNNSNFAYSYMTRSGYADGYYEWHLSFSGSRAFFYENDEIVLETKILRSVLIREYGSYIRVVNKDTCWTAPKPTMDLKITNTGTGRVYFGGYYIKGSGKDTSVTDISRILYLAYATARLSGSVTGLNAKTFYALYNYAISLTKTSSGSIKNYISETTPLSNAGGNKYAYQALMQSPFYLQRKNCYYQMHIGLMGTKSSTLKFKVNIKQNYATSVP